MSREEDAKALDMRQGGQYLLCLFSCLFLAKGKETSVQTVFFEQHHFIHLPKIRIKDLFFNLDQSEE